MAETFTKEQFWAILEEAGEDEVRLRIKLQKYGPNSDKFRLAEEWLRQKDQERIDASRAAQLDVARSTKDASWVAAEAAREAVREAKKANVIATLALIAAAIAIPISIIALFARSQ